MLDGERGQVRVGRQIAGGAEGFEETEQDLGMALARIQTGRHFRVRAVQPIRVGG